MAGGLMVMALFENGAAERVISRDINTTFVCR